MKKIQMILLCLCLAVPCTVNAGELEGSPNVSALSSEAGDPSCVEAVPRDQTLSILFIGNSITYSGPSASNNKFIAYFKKLAKSAHRKITVQKVAYGGRSLKDYGNPRNYYGKKAQRAIKSRKWDYIVIQENTDYAVARYKTMEKNAKRLVRIARKKNQDVQIIFHATWTYKKVKKLFGHIYSQKKQQKLIDSHYARLAASVGGVISWSGDAFWAYRSNYNRTSLYRRDKNHPSESGAFLSACCMYATIFRESPEAGSYCPLPVSAANASLFKALACTTCL